MSYYTDTVARGLEDYYAGRGEAAGVWVGKGSAAAGLAGEVTPEQLRLLFEGSHPFTGESLGLPYTVRAGADRVTGWDLTFSAPKSVSTLWAVGGGDLGIEVRDAHDAAVRAALTYLEEHAAFSRTGKAGIRQVDTDGLLAAAFVHRTSRTGDPQLHTHVLVSGRVRCPDGVWRALDSRALHRQLKPAGMLYQAALRAELTARLGVAWTEVDRHGQAELEGVPDGLRQHFSSRRTEVEVRAKERIAKAEVELGRSLTPEERRRHFERAVLETRTAKQLTDGTDQGLHDRWQAEATAIGHPSEQWAPGTLDRRLSAAWQDVDRVIADVLDELATTKSTFARSDVVQQVVRRTPATLGDAEAVRQWIESTADQVLGHDLVLSLAAPSLDVPEALRRRDGQSVFEPHGAARFSTIDTLAIEQHVLDTVLAGRDARRAVVDRRTVELAIVDAGLGQDQADAVRRVTSDGEAVACVIGPAGTGKSRAMRAAAHAWADSGIPVRGLALSAVAAGVLQAEAGIHSDTIAKFLFEHDRPAGPNHIWQLRRGEVLVVDEAGMVATRDLARLVTLADHAQAKVVLVGDHAQLGAIEAGGLFRLLAHDTAAAELHEVRRFTHPWEATASLALRDRWPDAIADYDDHGRILGGDRLAMIDEAFNRWHHAHQLGESIVVVAADHNTVDALATRARAARVEAGEVEPDGIHVGGHIVGVGDEIVTTRNDRRLITNHDGWVRNGDRWHVEARYGDGSLTVSDLTGRGRVTLPADYVQHEVALGYALTIHKAQGVTVDHSILIADDRLGAEALYVAMTRGRHDNTALVITDHLEAESHDQEQPIGPSQVLAGALARPAAERAALEYLRDTLDRGESLAVLAPRLANLDAWIVENAPPDRSDELARAQRQLDQAAGYANPGRLTRAGRDDRRHLDRLTDNLHRLGDAQDNRQAWLTEHAETLSYRQELLAQAEDRRRQLGVNAAQRQPAHVLDLIGSFPTEPDRAESWITKASSIEAYREEWGIEPDQLRDHPVDRVQAREWELAIGIPLDTQRIEARLAARDLDVPYEQGFGIEL